MHNKMFPLNQLGESISNLRVIENYFYNFIQIINVRTFYKQLSEELDHTPRSAAYVFLLCFSMFHKMTLLNRPVEIQIFEKKPHRPKGTKQVSNLI